LLSRLVNSCHSACTFAISLFSGLVTFAVVGVQNFPEV
jgi:hypothetical protein